ncbi:MAG: DUF3857 domain-containing protein [Candidatus Eisenbacteria sp.]|nr:DUF3857 domain-containing protein [Candidatus Eisenbacteria bacterium]
MSYANTSARGGLVMLFALALLAGVAGATPMAASGGHDIGELMEDARAWVDFSRMDAVILLEETSVEVLAGGGMRTTVHEIIWIGTDLGLDTYGDLRIPYRSDRAELKVHTLRTWRDQTWWPAPQGISPTAVVETLPGALSRADDYTAMRETMLLHDGIEIPCVVETRYEITDRGAGGETRDGSRLFSRADPAVRVIFRLSVPRGMRAIFALRNGAPQPEVLSQGTYVWRQERVERLPRPLTDAPAAYLPCVIWSAWESWDALGSAFSSAFEAAQVVGATLGDSLHAAIEHEPDARSRATAVSEFVDEWTRAVHYDDQSWTFEPRPADRTWETAYGHTLDRAVLAAALFREAGLEVAPIFRSRTPGRVEATVPALAWFDRLVLALDGKDDGLAYRGYYDPEDGRLVDFAATLAGYAGWTPGSEPEFFAGPSRGELFVALTLEPGEEGAWTGNGYLRGIEGLAPHAELSGLEGETAAWIGSVAGVIEGAELTEHSVATLEPGAVAAGFSFDWTEGDPDEYERVTLTLGDPAGGVIAHLPHDVALCDERRDSPVMPSSPMRQRVKLRLAVGDREVVYAPAPMELATAVGRFSISVDQQEGWLTIIRELAIDETRITPEMWPELRALLLADNAPRNRRVMLRSE